MQKIFDIGERLFFNNILICLLSYIYFNIIPINKVTLLFGFIFSILFFGINLYTGYDTELLLKESLIVGVMGCGLGIFLYLLSLYIHFIMNDPKDAAMLVEPYFSPTMSIIKVFFKKVDINYPIIIVAINTGLVVLGNLLRRLVRDRSVI